jgi:hypothetical protein
MQLARNLLDAGNGFLRGAQYLILDRDPLYSTAFRRLLRDSGVTPLLLPARSPSKRVRRAVCLVRQIRVLGPSCYSARHISGQPSAPSWLIITKNGRTKAWTTSALRPRRRRRD